MTAALSMLPDMVRDVGAAEGTVPASQVRLPGSFRAWLSGALVSQLGDAVLYFALGWAASAHGGIAAGLVLSCVALSRTALLLFGGALGDRWGARSVMITGDAVMLVLAASLGITAWLTATPVGLLVVAALVMGVVDAFYLPSSGSMPRRLVRQEALPRAVALRQTGSQVITIVGGPLGGAVVAAAGLAAAAWLDAATFAVVLVVLIAIRARFDAPVPPRRRLLGDIADGVSTVVRTPGLGTALLLVAGVAGLITPVGSLLVPLLARGNGWSATEAGIVLGSQSLGTITVTLTVARRGVAARPAYLALAGLGVAAGGETLLATGRTSLLAAAGAAVLGAGIGLFVTQLAPVLLATAPRSHLARVQSLLSIVQSTALLISNNLLGALTRFTTPRITLLLCAAGLAVAALIAASTPTVRAINHTATD